MAPFLVFFSFLSSSVVLDPDMLHDVFLYSLFMRSCSTYMLRRFRY